jgi:hypothetical protein
MENLCFSGVSVLIAASEEDPFVRLFHAAQ